MTYIAIPTEKNPELTSSGFVESLSVSSIAEFNPTKITEEIIVEKVEKEKNDFINTFICHLIFYGIFCISLILHVLFDLGLRSFLSKIFIHLIEIVRNIIVEKNPSFA